jgi:hypothetical protein
LQLYNVVYFIELLNSLEKELQTIDESHSPRNTDSIAVTNMAAVVSLPVITSSCESEQKIVLEVENNFL